MTGRRVLVLRPEPGASETAARLRALGLVPVVMPLSEIHELTPQTNVDLAHIACVAATSVNAMRHAQRSLLDEIIDKPLFAVGDATAQAAIDAGFSTVRAGSDDGSALARLILQSQPDGAVLYLCGRVRRPEFERMLRERGLRVLPVEVYDAVPIDRAADFGVVASQEASVVVMCHSPEAARTLATLIEGVPDLSRRVNAVAISARAAQPLRAIGVAVDIAATPTDQAMLALLN